MELEFFKMSGAGNDFIVINNMDGRLPESGRESLFADWCRRGMSIGADGVLVLEPSARAHFRMRYYNADGREAETCGNGSRCIARFAHVMEVAPASMRFETMAGEYEARVEGETVVVGLSDAHGLREGIAIAEPEFTGTVHFVNTGVPHAVVLCGGVDVAERIAALDVVRMGRCLRYHREFAPAGANANFIEVTGPQAIAIRTYERGVENETLACGTGSVAACIIAARRGLVTTPVSVRTAGGDTLTVDFEPSPGGARGVKLGGPARIVFRGYVPWPE
ncbi:MAG: diaminopimelate epimerase [Candidatus Sumerlaeaceae bacterium]|nr:diaminopimelate epimerase [Candidatus Sumerlaeaceae bacterium]